MSATETRKARRAAPRLQPRLQEDHELLIEAVRAAGAIAARYFRKDQRVWEKSPGHLVSEADLAVNDFLREALQGPRSGYGWLSEESADDPSRLEARALWIVDPIDGTRSFLKGIPEFSVSVGLAIEGRAAAAAVYNPAADELFEVFSGGGARLQGEPIEVSPKRTLEGAAILSGRTEMQQKTWSPLVPQARIHPIGSIAYKLALVAAGRFDAMVSLWPKHEWDIVAGELLVTEAGGKVSTAQGERLRYNQKRPRFPNVMASNGRLHEALMNALAEKAP